MGDILFEIFVLVKSTLRSVRVTDHDSQKDRYVLYI